jgi:type II secretory pathway component PulF
MSAVTFAYRAQTTIGEPMTGTIDADSIDDAGRRLRTMQLRAIEIDPISPSASPAPRPLRAGDFQTFNTQLAHLTTAGLPVEQSLQLIAHDMQSPRLKQAVQQIVAELESGKTLPQALAAHSRQFPPMYSTLVDAGVRSGNLPGILLNLGRHMELVNRLRATLWRAMAYPIMVLLGLNAVIWFLGLFVLPKFRQIFLDFRTDLPGITKLLLNFSDLLQQAWPILLVALAALIIGLPILWRMLRHNNLNQRILETIVFPLPLIGTTLRRNALARWCDALNVAIEAGLDLPTAIKLAGDAVGSPLLQSDGQKLIDALQAGRQLDQRISTRLLPMTVVATLSLASTNNDLPSAMKTLGEMFQQQADIKMALIPAILTPWLLVIVGFTIGFVVVALFAPMISLIEAVSGPKHW